MFLWGGSKYLMREKSEEKYMMIEIRPERYIDGQCSDITLNRRDMRNKFEYTTLSKIMSEGNVLNTQRFG